MASGHIMTTTEIFFNVHLEPNAKTSCYEHSWRSLMWGISIIEESRYCRKESEAIILQGWLSGRYLPYTCEGQQVEVIQVQMFRRGRSNQWLQKLLLQPNIGSFYNCYILNDISKRGLTSMYFPIYRDEEGDNRPVYLQFGQKKTSYKELFVGSKCQPDYCSQNFEVKIKYLCGIHLEEFKFPCFHMIQIILAITQ